MVYTVKEIYYTLQGEGHHTGRPAIFCRFAGCNLWTGLERDRKSAICQFCDTDFVGTGGPGGGKFRTASDLAKAVKAKWPSREISAGGSKGSADCASPVTAPGTPYVVCTGGEPLLQLDDALIAAFHAEGLEIAIETNGTIKAPDGIDWICVSPKIGADLVQTSGDEIKLVYPQTGGEPEQFEGLDFAHFYLQPMDSPQQRRNIGMVVDYCKDHPRWSMSLQTHKVMDIP